MFEKKKSKKKSIETTEQNVIIENIPMGLYWKDTDFVYRGFNSNFRNMTNLSADKVKDKTDFDIHSQEVAEQFRKEDEEFKSRHRTSMYYVDKQVHIKDSAKPMWGRTYKIPIYNEDSSLRFILGLIQDVTEVKQAEIDLAENESRLRTILNSTNDRIIFVEDGQVLSANDSFLNDFVKVQTKESAGKTLDLKDLIAPKFYKKLKQKALRAIKLNTPQYFDLSPEDSGTGKYFDVSVFPVTHNRKVAATAIFAKDITQKKEYEIQLIQRGKELESAIVEADKANKSKSEFLSRMSHEIRTPISAIIGMTKIASTSDDMEKIKDCLRKIDTSSRHLLGVINDVLDMSKIEADKFSLSNAIFKFENMLMDVVSIISVRADEKKQNFDVILDETLPECFFADELHLKQVITNLLSNAVKFTPDFGCIKLEILNRGIVDDVADIGVAVVDTGIGITQEQIQRLFQPFEQAEGGISRKYGGTGLGLVICKKIIEKMGGEIRVESSPGVGSSFIFNVKMKVHKLPRAATLSSVSFRNMRALIVDDNADTRDYLKHILYKAGIACDSAESGVEAISKCGRAEMENNPFNIFFIDWLMPGMNGIETARKIKSLADKNSIIIMISSAEWDRISQDALQAGVERFIAKPFFPSTVINVLTEIAGGYTLPEQTNCYKNIPDLSTYKVLLAEDMEINREIAAALLEPSAIKIEFAVNGKEALEKFNADKESYDLILMDIQMPEMDGYEVTKKIRNNGDEKSKSIPILAMTADAFKEDIDRCKDCGMNEHISKPIDETELFRKLIAWLISAK